MQFKHHMRFTIDVVCTHVRFFIAERVVFAADVRSRVRGIVEKQRTNWLAATYVGPRVEAGIAHQPDAIKSPIPYLFLTRCGFCSPIIIEKPIQIGGLDRGWWLARKI